MHTESQRGHHLPAFVVLNELEFHHIGIYIIADVNVTRCLWTPQKCFLPVKSLMSTSSAEQRSYAHEDIHSSQRLKAKGVIILM